MVVCPLSVRLPGCPATKWRRRAVVVPSVRQTVREGHQRNPPFSGDALTLNAHDSLGHHPHQQQKKKKNRRQSLRRDLRIDFFPVGSARDADRFTECETGFCCSTTLVPHSPWPRCSLGLSVCGQPLKCSWRMFLVPQWLTGNWEVKGS